MRAAPDKKTKKDLPIAIVRHSMLKRLSKAFELIPGLVSR